MRRPGPLLAVILVAGLVGSVPVTLARFGDSAISGASFATGSLAPPTNLAGTGGASVALTWTPSTSTAAEGYQVLRSATSGSGYAVVGTVTPVGASGTVDSPGGGTWYYVLRTYLQNWTSADSNETSVVVTGSATGFQACASNAADTGGDNDGYELNGASGCVTDGTIARDAVVGHQYRQQLLQRRQGPPPLLGVRARPAALGDLDRRHRAAAGGRDEQQRWHHPDLRRAVLGCRGDLDGQQGDHADRHRAHHLQLGVRHRHLGPRWTASELDPANLRVRLIDVSTQNTKTFRLDGVSVQVTYTP